ncbi:MAG: PAS domain S-box protein [Bacteroidetes bacterium]|nr:PAS domain S-box protein [Bacteroidota bacterium]MBU1719371.1 PAS domain S-box protein [Bacteroidota bacterium]
MTREELITEVLRLQQLVQLNRAVSVSPDSEDLSKVYIQALDNIPGVHLHVIDRNFVVEIFNRNFEILCEDLGLEKNAIGKNLHEVFPFLSENVWEEYNQVFDSGNPCMTTDETPVSSTIIYTRTYKIPIFRENKVVRVITCMLDITESRSREKNLRESLDKTNALVKAVPGIIFVFNRKLQILEVKTDNESELAFPSSEILGKKLTDIPLPENLIKQTVDAAEIVFRTGKPHNFRYHLDFPDGRKYFEARYIKVDEDRLLSLISNQTDIQIWQEKVQLQNTELSQTNQQLSHANSSLLEMADRLRKSEQMFRAVTENTSDVTVIVSADRRFMYASPSVKKVFGYDPQFLIDRKVSSLVFPGDIEKFRGTLERTAETTESVEVEGIRIIRADGTAAYVEALITSMLDDPMVGGIVINCRDISERVETETRLFQTREDYRMILDNIQDLYYRSDLSGKVLLFNEAGIRMFGLSGSNEILGADLTRLLYNDPKDRRKFVDQILAHGEVTDFELELRTRSGELKVVSFNSRLLKDENGTPIAIEGIGRDVTERKHTEIALQKSEEWQRAILQNMGDAMFVHESDGKILEVNQQAAILAGLSIEELKSLNIKKITRPEVFVKRMEQLWTSGNKVFEGIIRNISGEEIPVSISAGIFDWDRKKVVIAFARNIKDLKIAETALSESEKRYRELVERNPNAILVHQGGIIRYLNNTAAKLFGIENAEVLIGTPALNVVHPDYREKAIERITKIFKTGENAPPTEEVLLRADGTTFDAEVSGIPIQHEGLPAVLVVASDITESKKVRREREETERKYRLLAENTSDIISLHELDGKYLFASSVVEKMIGYTPEELVGKSPVQFIHPDDSQAVIEVISAGLKAKASTIYRYRILKRDGSYLWVETSSNPVVDQDTGEIHETVCVSRDITSIIETENLRKEKEAAELASHTKSEFLANMSHEIRNPMNVIVGMTNTLQRTQLNDEQRKFVGALQISSGNLMNIINDILDFSKIEANKIELTLNPFNIRTMFNGIIQQYQNLAKEKGIGLSSSVSDDIPEILIGDSGKIRQILINLTSNALKYTQKGTVEVATSLLSMRDKVAEVVFRVSDTGIGIRKEDFGKLFQSFTQLDSSTTKEFSGTGLGLVIVKRYTEFMSGKVSFQSDPDNGTTFYVTLPLEESAVALKETELDTLSDSTDQSRVKLRILLAEDDAINRLYLKNFLAGQGWTVDTAVNGLQVLEKMDLQQFDLILMDGQMPKMDGFEATREIRKTNTGIPVVAITGYAVKGDKERFFDAGMNGYVTKPINERELISVILELTRK